MMGSVVNRRCDDDPPQRRQSLVVHDAIDIIVPALPCLPCVCGL